jgi:hypothetical protein
MRAFLPLEHISENWNGFSDKDMRKDKNSKQIRFILLRGLFLVGCPVMVSNRRFSTTLERHKVAWDSSIQYLCIRQNRRSYDRKLS